MRGYGRIKGSGSVENVMKYLWGGLVLAVSLFSVTAGQSRAQSAPADEDRLTDADMCMGIYTAAIAADTSGDTTNLRTGLAVTRNVFSELTGGSDEDTVTEAASSAATIMDMVKEGTNTLDGFRAECDAEFMADQPLV